MRFTEKSLVTTERDLNLFYLYRITSRLYFHLPILFPFLYSMDMGIFFTEILLAVYGLVIMLTSNASGVLLHHMKQKSIVACGEILKAIGLFIVVIGTRVAHTNFWIVLLGQALGGLGFSLTVSTESVLLRSITAAASVDDARNVVNRPAVKQTIQPTGQITQYTAGRFTPVFSLDSFGKIQSKSQSYMFLSTFISGIVGSILFDYEAHWPFLASISANLIAIIFVLLINEVQPESKKQTDVRKVWKNWTAFNKYPSALGTKNSIQGWTIFTDFSLESQGCWQPIQVALNKEQSFWVNFYALSRAFTLAPFVGLLPFFFVMLQLDQYLFGAVLGLFSIAAFGAALYSNRLLAELGVQVVMPAIMSCMLASMLLFGFFDYFSDYFLIGLIALFLLGLGSGGVRPLTMNNLNLTSFGSQQRAKILSLMEQRFGIYNTLLLVGGGCLLIEQGFQPLMIELAGLYILLLSGVFVSNNLGKHCSGAS